MTNGNSREDWYNNKQLFEKLIRLSEDVVELRGEMRETRSLIKEYNGLRKQIEEVKKDNAVIGEKISTIVHKEEGKDGVWDNLRNWGGWIFGFLTLVILIYNQII